MTLVEWTNAGSDERSSSSPTRTGTASSPGPNSSSISSNAKFFDFTRRYADSNKDKPADSARIPLGQRCARPSLRVLADALSSFDPTGGRNSFREIVGFRRGIPFLLVDAPGLYESGGKTPTTPTS